MAVLIATAIAALVGCDQRPNIVVAQLDVENSYTAPASAPVITFTARVFGVREAVAFTLHYTLDGATYSALPIASASHGTVSGNRLSNAPTATDITLTWNTSSLALLAAESSVRILLKTTVGQVVATVESSAFRLDNTATAPASNPSPANNAVSVDTNPQLSWTAAPGPVSSFDVYLGTSNPPGFLRNVAATNTNVGPLNAGTTYYWRVDTWFGATVVAGPVWSFTTNARPVLGVPQPNANGDLSALGADYLVRFPTGSALSLQVTATDADAADSITLTASATGGTLSAAQLGLTQALPLSANGVSPVSLALTGTTAQLGYLLVRFTATDPAGNATSYSVRIESYSTNGPTLDSPVTGGNLSNAAGEWTVQVGVNAAFSIAVTATDPDSGDTVTVAAARIGGTLTGPQAGLNQALPASVNGIAPQTLTLTGTAASVGTLQLEYTATDSGGAIAVYRLTLQITSVAAPVLAAPSTDGVRSANGADYTVSCAVGTSLGVVVTASDADPGDTLTFTATRVGGTLTAAEAGLTNALPLSANGASPRTLSLSGTAAMAGTLIIEFKVVDSGGLQASYRVTLSIPSPQTPSLADPVTTGTRTKSNGNWTIRYILGDSMSVSVTASDTDAGDTLTVTATRLGGTLTAAQAGLTQGLPNSIVGASPQSLVLSGTAATDGTLILEIKAVDTLGLQSAYQITLEILPNHAPVLAAPVTTQSIRSADGANWKIEYRIGNSLRTSLTATDADAADTLTLTVSRIGGTLTAAEAGFVEALPSSVNGSSPQTLLLTGVGTTAGTIILQYTATDQLGLQATVNVTAIILPTNAPYLYSPSTGSTGTRGFDSGNWSVTYQLPDAITVTVGADDDDGAAEILTLTCTRIGGTLTAAEFGLNETLPLLSAGAPIRAISLSGQPKAIGNCLLKFNVVDGTGLSTSFTLNLIVESTTAPVFGAPTTTGTRSGSANSWSVQYVAGTAISIDLTAYTDPGNALTLSVERHSGTLTEAQAGLTTVLPATTSGASPMSISVTGTANLVGNLVLRYTATDAEGDTSYLTINLKIVTGAPNRLVFRAGTGPDAVSGLNAPLAPVQIEVHDSQGNFCSTATTTVTISLDPDPSNNRLTGTKTQNAVKGVAAFGRLMVNTVGRYTLIASAAGLFSGTGASFDVVDDTPTVTLIGALNGTLKGVVALSVNIAQARSLPVEVAIECDPDGVGNYQRIYQAPNTLGNGTNGAPTSPAGTTSIFYWDSARNLPDLATGSLAIRVVATVNGVSSVAQAWLNRTLDNRVNFAGTQTFANSPNRVVAADMDGNGTTEAVFGDRFQAFIRIGQPATTLVLSSAPNDLVVADFNRDGRLDVAAAHQTGFAVILQSSATRGQYGAAVDTAAFASPCTRLVTGDFNRDGVPDLAFAIDGSNEVWTASGVGDGTFLAVTRVATSIGATDLAVGDVNRDGWDDIITCSETGNRIDGLLGSAAGFGAVQLLQIAVTPVALKIADFNGDGRLDLITADGTSDSVSFFPHDTASWNDFLSATTVSAGDDVMDLAVADFNRDGALDVALASKSSANLTLILTRELSPVWLAATPFSLTQASPFEALAVCDMNSDGRLDLFAACPSAVSGGLYELRNVQPLSPGERMRGSFVLTGTPGRGYAIADVNRDGRADVVAPADKDNVLWYAGLGDGTFGAPTIVPAGGVNPFAVTVGDMNRDGRLDLVIGLNGSPMKIAICLQAADGSFGAPTLYTSAPSAQVSLTVHVVDLNLDGRPDVVSSDGRALLQNSDGTLGAPINTGVSGHLVVADFNTDGKPDLAGGSSSLLVRTNDGTAAFTTLLNRSMTIDDLATGDLNSDGLADLIASDINANVVRLVLQNTATPGTFAATVSNTVTKPTGVFVVDYDHAGNPELAVGGNTGDDVTVYQTTSPQFTFGTITSALVGDKPQRIRAADLNGDGHLDLIVSDGGGLTVALRDRNSNFCRRETDQATAQMPNAVAVADIDYTGRLDLVLATGRSSAGDQADVRPQQTGADPFPTSIGFGASHGAPYDVAIGDLDGDGRPDIVLALNNDPGIGVIMHDPAVESFLPIVRVATDGTVSNVALGDLNGDGCLDVVAAGDGGVYVLMQKPAARGTFDTNVKVADGFMMGVAVADLDRDGRLDVITSSRAAAAGLAKIVIVRQSPTVRGQFEAPLEIALNADYAAAIRVADLTADGRPDIAVVTRASNVSTVEVFEQDELSFAYTRRYTGNPAAADTIDDMVVGDWDRNGRMDLVLVQDYSTVTVLLNTGQAEFTSPPRCYGVANSASSLAVADFNRDGWLDVVSCADTNRFSTLLSRR